MLSEEFAVKTGSRPTFVSNICKAADSVFSERLIGLLKIAAIAGLVLMVLAPVFFVPAEDALILHQYSDNLAYTGQITYNRGGPRVEGATDFLWMAFLALMRVFHISPYYATAAVNLGSIITIAGVLLSFARERVRFGSLLLLVGALMLAPPISAALAGFSVLPFCMLIILSALFFDRGKDAAMAAVLLVLCLFRPDGVIFALPLIAIRIFSPNPRKLSQVATYFGVFVLPGIFYFLWRWNYFGEFLPLPFLVKSDVHRVLGVAIGGSTVDILKYIAFNIALLPLALGKQLLSRRNVTVLIAIGIVPTLFYLTMRLDQDVADRFFLYLLLCPAILIAINWRSLRISKRQLTASCVVLWLLLLAFPWGLWMTRFFSDGHKNNVVAISRELATVQPKGVLALSEAGRIAYYSQWRTLDLWGLNTPEFAHHLTSPSDIITHSPDVLVLYYPQTHDDCRYSSNWQIPHTQRTWPGLAQNVIAGIHAARNYDLWMVPSSGLLRRMLHGYRAGAGEYQCWYVKRSFSGHSAVAQILQEHGAIAGSDFSQLRFASSQGTTALAPSTTSKAKE